MTDTPTGNELSADDVTAIHELIEPWNAYVLKGDWDGLLSMCTGDMIFMPPDGMPVEGEDAIRPWLETLPRIKEMWWDIDDVQGRGDLACLRGSVKETFDVDGQDVKFDGKYCDVVRKGEDGQWRFALVIWNSNAPPG